MIPPVLLTVDTRRRVLATFTSVGLGGTLVPGVAWARMQEACTDRTTLPTVADALELSGIELELLALVRACQDASTWHTRRPAAAGA